MVSEEEKTISTEVFVPKGTVSRGDILAQALMNVKDDIPKASLPLYEINEEKTKAATEKALKRKDAEPGTTFVVDVTYRDRSDGEDVTVDEVIHGLKAPASFDPEEAQDDHA
jgi:hypothetical protein